MIRGLIVGMCVSQLSLTGMACAQENKFKLSAQLVEVYDSNILRIGDQRTDNPTDNVSMSPRVAVDFDRRFGRQRAFITGYAGYNFNSRFRFLNREDLALNSGLDLRFGPRCRITPTVSVLRGQSDLEDLGQIVTNAVTVQDYNIRASCPRPAGFYPTVGAGYYQVRNSEIRRERDQSIVDARFGVAYARPSIGNFELFGQITRIQRNRRDPTPAGLLRDETDVRTIALRFSRDVGTRFESALQIGYTNVDPKTVDVPRFSGLTYQGSLTYQPTPPLALTVAFGRQVSGRGNVGTSYYVSENAEFRARAKLTARTSVGAGVQLSKRDFAGEDRVFQFGPRGQDRQLEANATIGYRLARPINLDLSTRYRRRNAENNFYDYDSFSATLAAAMSF
ncbi:outer membrane beta-barrel protein [Sphingomonas sp. LB3N6]|uniref:outer membrane beta-barrel protein n=1 Tax=Sphingomonas fucosidasi TaxID=3096164 RepID=UPI002FCA110C